ncbi:hypothetical protein [Nocardioides sp. GY 10127]|uniref:hypothetical protein n=1 Tax=Nocardioides sp. GY 10127 TaxID=2569762 RepID=UPI0010A847D9|nr:hypothetical protein [Nocardioides sp. GY 10127]TIC79477.1 hypothetical protein E8D37_18105 [Nocardioides sp. GY 10127]
MSRIAVVPGVLALLPDYPSRVDPVADLRAACLEAVRWVGAGGPVRVVGDAQGARVAEALLGAASVPVSGAGDGAAGVLVVANGTARRTEKAPGYLDDRAAGFDAALGAALRGADAEQLTALDTALAGELLVGHPAGWVELGSLLAQLPSGEWAADVLYDDDPFGVQYWVATLSS